MDNNVDNGFQNVEETPELLWNPRAALADSKQSEEKKER